jgi:hypothetical protein
MCRNNRSVPDDQATHRPDGTVPKHPLAQAIGYTLNQCAELTLFTTDRAVPLHNHLAEQQMKRMALLRNYAHRRIMRSDRRAAV